MSLKKVISTGLCVSLLITSSPLAFAETLNSTNTTQPSVTYTIPDASTLQSKLQVVEQSVYGQGQTGALLSRISRLENDFYGKTSGTNTAISDRINTLYSTMFDNSIRPSAITQMNGIEWFLSGHVSINSITDRITALETTLYGKAASGTLQKRMNDLALLAYGNSDAKTPLVSTSIPADTLIKIKLVTPLNSETTKAGDIVKFQAAEDIIYNGKLIVAAGSPGEGVVTKVKGAQNFGRNGEIDVDFQQIQSFDGTTLKTFLGDKAKMEIKNLAYAAGASVAGIALLGPIGIVGGIFVQGKDVDLPAGTEAYIQTKEETTIYAIQTNLKDNLRVNTPEVKESTPVEETNTSNSETTYVDNSVNTSTSSSTVNTSSSSTSSSSDADYSISDTSDNDVPSDNNLYEYEY
ncbi:MAG TPA: hypothetical protein K8V65_03120 [Megamonas hypermegale]|uniref:Uncharacterized protein n=1 Tax=Megamonas hypermegale TaxID=158847 RepID=A0A921HNR0_9FIRM|nr:hypothetical protein [Megamonas hypermegale]MDM8143348.1 hypothetical protein [Megamonas hypermegale]HJF84640.1 hypothetical protein [Megamonas hypermegale]